MEDGGSLVEEEGLEGDLLRIARFLYTSNTFSVNTWPWIVGLAATLLVGYFCESISYEGSINYSQLFQISRM